MGTYGRQFEKISKAGKAFQDLEDELDYLLTSDPAFIEKVRRSRKAHIEDLLR